MRDPALERFRFGLAAAEDERVQAGFVDNGDISALLRAIGAGLR